MERAEFEKSKKETLSYLKENKKLMNQLHYPDRVYFVETINRNIVSSSHINNQYCIDAFNKGKLFWTKKKKT